MHESRNLASPHPMQDNSDVAMLVRRIGANGLCGPLTALSAEEALVCWMLDLPDRASVVTAARYVLRHADAGPANSAEVERFFGYLRQTIAFGGHTPPSRRRTRRRNYRQKTRP